MDQCHAYFRSEKWSHNNQIALTAMGLGLGSEVMEPIGVDVANTVVLAAPKSCVGAMVGISVWLDWSSAVGAAVSCAAMGY